MGLGEVMANKSGFPEKPQALEENIRYIWVENRNDLQAMLLNILDIDPDQYPSFNSIRLSDTSYRILFDMLKTKFPLTVVVEDYYVDRFYRDSYYLYYASKHIQYSRFCKRVFLFDGLIQSIFDIDESELEKMFMGTMVVRPLPLGKIGRSLFNPYFFADKKSYLRYATYEIVVVSKQLRIHAFPFSMQDGETTTCAEITILNLIDYFSRKYQDYNLALPSDLFERVDRLGYERCLPSRGLSFLEISRIFSESGFFPRMYAVASFQSEYQFKRNMHYYIESGIPVALGIQWVNSKEKHAITCIGHGKRSLDSKKITDIVRVFFNKNVERKNIPVWVIDTADLYDEYIVMDDGDAPYIKYEWKKIEEAATHKSKMLVSKDNFTINAEPQNMMVPLSKRMFLEAEDAFDRFVDYLSRKDLGIKAKTGKNIGTSQNPLVLRMFLASSRHFRQARIKDLKSQLCPFDILYSSVLFPKFVWVCEVYSIESYYSKNPRVIAELVIDATSSSRDINNVIITNYGNTMRISNSIGSNYDSQNGRYLFNYYYNTDKPMTLSPYTHNLHQPSNVYKC